MKKLYIKYCICLVLGLLTNNALLSLLLFNQRFNIYFLTGFEIELPFVIMLPFILTLFASGIISVIFNVIFSKIARKPIY